MVAELGCKTLLLAQVAGVDAGSDSKQDDSRCVVPLRSRLGPDLLRVAT